METISKKAVSIYRYHLSWLRGVSKLVFTVFYLAYVAGLFVAGAYVGKLANEGEILANQTTQSMKNNESQDSIFRIQPIRTP